MHTDRLIIDTLLNRYPSLQAIYLFGSLGTDAETEKSDADIAILLSHAEAKQTPPAHLFDTRCALADALHRDVDLVNARAVNTVLRKEIVFAARRIYCADPYEADMFEMLTISYYQKLNEERAGILAEIKRSGRILAA